MSCYGCARKFTVIKKEHACPGCGFAYCKNCLNNKIHIEKLNKSKKACIKCKKMADNPNKIVDPNDIEPPKAYLRRIESLDNPSKPPITLYQHSSRMQQLKRGMSEADCEIAERLEKLRDDRKKYPLPSDQEIKERLAKLRDEPSASNTKSVLPKIDTRTDQQKCDDLLKQCMEECQLEESKSTIDKEIRKRLDNLNDNATGVNKPVVSNDNESTDDIQIPIGINLFDFQNEDLTDDEMALQLLQKILSPQYCEHQSDDDFSPIDLSADDDDDIDDEDDDDDDDDNDNVDTHKNVKH